jgi:hypothetical protein
VVGCILLVAVLANRASDLVSAAARQRRAAQAGVVVSDADEPAGASVPVSSSTASTSTEGMERQ